MLVLCLSRLIPNGFYADVAKLVMQMLLSSGPTAPKKKMPTKRKLALGWRAAN